MDCSPTTGLVMPLTILTACTSRAWGGMEMSLVQTSVRLRARGYDVVPLCAPGSAIEERLRAEGFTPVLGSSSIRLKNFGRA